MKTKTVKSASIGITAAAVGAALLMPRAQAAIPETIVDPGDPVMKCEGERILRHYGCSHVSTEVLSSKEINLPAEKVTDNVAGCRPGEQPSVSVAVNYSKTATVSVNVGVKFDLKVLTGATGAFSKIKELGPGLSAGASWSWSTTFGKTMTRTVTADYGKVSWGIFSQEALESHVNQTIKVNDRTIGGGVKGRFTARNMPIVIPKEEGQTKFPKGTFGKDQRDFKDLEEFKKMCGENADPPKYLGGKDPAPEPDPGKPDPGEPGALPCDSFLKVVAAGSDAKVISSNVRTDLENKCKNIQAHIQNGGDPASLVTELQRSIQKGESDGHINREYSHKLDAEAKALLNAKS